MPNLNVKHKMATDTFKIDGEKIDFHPERVEQWINTGNNWDEVKKVYPIYAEITPIGGCNHRCSFCCVDYIGYQNRSLDEGVFKRTLSDMGELGVKSVMYAGEGEPLLYKNLSGIIEHAKGAGIDNSITTNANALTEKFAKEALPYTTWIKASINAGSPENYAKIHGTKPENFEKAFRNMERAAKIREEYKLDHLNHTLGAQMVLLPENAQESLAFASRAKEAGLDYAVIKPYSQHKKSITKLYEGMSYDDYMEMEKELDSLSSDSFKVIFRKKTMEGLEEGHSYPKCLSTPFMWAYVMASGDVYGCSAYLLDEKFNYGNLSESSFQEIWEGEKRKANMEFVLNELNISECRVNCRMDRVNRRLDEIINMENPIEQLQEINNQPTPNHVNFI